MYNDDFLAFY